MAGGEQRERGLGQRQEGEQDHAGQVLIGCCKEFGFCSQYGETAGISEPL